MTLDQGTEFMKEFAKTIKDDYGIKMTPETHPTLDKAQRTAMFLDDTAGGILNLGKLK